MLFIDVRVHRYRLGPLGKLADFCHGGAVILLNVLAGAGNGQLVEQGEKACGQAVHQVFGVALAGALGPFAKDFLRGIERLLDAGNAGALHERMVLAF